MMALSTRLESAIAAFVLAGTLGAAEPPPGARLKDLIAIEGVRENPLVGYGLVVGLNGTGDKRQTVFPAQSLSNLLERMGISVPATALQAKNVAAVMITSTLPAFAQPGTRLDATVAAIGDASNLQGGILVMTPLRAASGQVHAVAQGPVVTGGFAAGRGGNSQTVNHPTVGRVPGGAIVEIGPPSVTPMDHLRLQLARGDFSNAARVTRALNQRFTPPGGSPVARAENSNLILVDIPPSFRARPVEFIAELESLRIDTDRRARIIINERTGTITLGGEIRIGPSSILHGNLTVQVETQFDVSQPTPLSGGETAVVPRVGVSSKEEKARNVTLAEGATVDDLVRALTAIGATPRDVIAILQGLASAGSLNAEIEVI